MIVCKKCGYENPMNRRYCANCSARLNFNKTHSDFKREENSPKRSFLRFFKLLFKWGVPCVAVTSIVLLLMVPRVKVVEESYMSKKSLDGKYAHLREAFGRGEKRSVSVTGKELTSQIHYSSIENAVHKPRKDNSFISKLDIKIEKMFCDIDAGVLKATVVYSIKNKKIIMQVGIVPSVKDGKIAVDVKNASVGKLRLSSMVINEVLKKVSNSAKYSGYFKLPYYIKDITVENKVLILSSTKPGPSEKSEVPGKADDGETKQSDKRALIFEANAAFREEDYEKAIKLYKTFLEKYHDDMSADKVESLLEKAMIRAAEDLFW